MGQWFSRKRTGSTLRHLHNALTSPMLRAFHLPSGDFPCSTAVFCLQACTLSLMHWEDTVAMFSSVSSCPCCVLPALHLQSLNLLCQGFPRKWKWLTLMQESFFFAFMLPYPHFLTFKQNKKKSLVNNMVDSSPIADKHFPVTSMHKA